MNISHHRRYLLEASFSRYTVICSTLTGVMFLFRTCVFQEVACDTSRAMKVGVFTCNGGVPQRMDLGGSPPHETQQHHWGRSWTYCTLPETNVTSEKY